MSAPEKLYTEREVVLREREQAARVRCSALLSCDGAFSRVHRPYSEAACGECRRIAENNLPLPKVEKPRVVTIASEKDVSGHWVLHLRVIGGRVQYWYAPRDSTEVPFSRYTHDLFLGVKEGSQIRGDFENVVRALAREQLFERPTELAEDDSHV